MMTNNNGEIHTNVSHLYLHIFENHDDNTHYKTSVQNSSVHFISHNSKKNTKYTYKYTFTRILVYQV